MKVALVFLVGLVAVFGSEQQKFQRFKAQFNKTYATSAEEDTRFHIFKNNLNIIAAQNAKDPHAVYGVTKFADLSPQEFKDTYLMHVERTIVSAPVAKVTRTNLPSSFDWSSKGDVTPVKNQGQCGSCWDFSATETIESVCAIAGYPLNQLSEQQILDCDTSDSGCDGGWPYNAFQYVISAGGMDSESSYPYTAEDGSCQFNPANVECKVASWQYVTQDKDENAMQSFLYSNSPMSVCVDAETWQFYTSGVITTSSGCGDSIDHCVQITGYLQQSGMTVWNVRNSWGTDWGQNGYLWVQMGQDVCAIAEVVSVPCVTSTSGQTVC
jgi:C1A family cysteine protease